MEKEGLLDVFCDDPPLVDVDSELRSGDADSGTGSRMNCVPGISGVFVIDPLESLDILLYACFSHNVFQA